MGVTINRLLIGRQIIETTLRVANDASFLDSSMTKLVRTAEQFKSQGGLQPAPLRHPPTTHEPFPHR